jgi:sugar/nucleoside kinase (ribokinase family)
MNVIQRLGMAKRVRSDGWVPFVRMEPSKGIPQKILQMTRSVDILLVSLDEASALTGTHDPCGTSAVLCESGAREVALKVGRRCCNTPMDRAYTVANSRGVR